MKNIFFLLVIGIFFYTVWLNRTIVFPLSTNLTASPTPINVPTLKVLGLSRGKCQARLIDDSDEQAWLPDQRCTPGSINPNVNQENIYETICKSGFTNTIRPPSSYTNRLKKIQILEYGYENTDLKMYEEDHLIALELGGAPSDPQNLWPEPHPSMNEKDVVENFLHKRVCDGTIKLSQAQKIISSNWYEMYKKIRN